MFRLLFILFLAVPVLEIYLLIKIGSVLGAILTVALVVFTAVLGALLLRFQGFSTLNRVRAALGRGEVPAIEMFEGVILLISGALLLTPGFFTDSIGFLCLVPAIRRGLIIWILKQNLIMTAGTPGTQPNPQGPRTIEGESWRDDDDR